jgi:hypothetical protein
MLDELDIQRYPHLRESEVVKVRSPQGLSLPVHAVRWSAAGVIRALDPTFSLAGSNAAPTLPECWVVSKGSHQRRVRRVPQG